MNRFIKILVFLVFVLGITNYSFAVVKPAPGSNPDLLSYAFYLYYDNGQILADRDYQIKFDIINESFVPESVPESTDPASLYKAEIINHKYQTAKTFKFDPKKGNLNFRAGKIMINGPYVSDGLRVNFYDSQDNQLLTIFVNAGALCDDNNLCDSVAGEDEKTCPNDCKKARTTPRATVVSEPLPSEGGYDLNTILIYAVSGVGVGVGAWFGWKWWKKRKEGNFPLPPPSTPTAPISPSFGGPSVPLS